MTRTHVTEAVAIISALLYGVRRYYRNWGTTKQECRQKLPGDELVRSPALQSTEGVWIDAPVEAVWPWLTQLGQDRAGFYTFETIESLLGLEFQADTTIHPEWQRLSPGDPVRLAPPGWLGRKYGLLLTVSRIVENQTIVFSGAPPEFPWHAVWSFHLESHYDDQCRLLVRTRAGLRHPGQLFITELAGPAVTLTVRGMLLGIKERAEMAQRTHEKPRTSTTQHA